MKLAILLIEPIFNQKGWNFYTEFKNVLVKSKVPFREIGAHFEPNYLIEFKNKYQDHVIITVFLPLRRDKPGTGNYYPGTHSQKIIDNLNKFKAKHYMDTTNMYALRKPTLDLILGQGQFVDNDTSKQFHVNPDKYFKLNTLLNQFDEEPFPASKIGHSKVVYYDLCGVEVDKDKIRVTASNVPMIPDDCFLVTEPDTINKTREMNLLLLLCSRSLRK